jgi:hypothetical protein
MAGIFSTRTAAVRVPSFNFESSNFGTRHEVNVTRVALCGETLTSRDGPLPTLLQDPRVIRNIHRDTRIGVLKLVVAYQ